MPACFGLPHGNFDLNLPMSRSGFSPLSKYRQPLGSLLKYGEVARGKDFVDSKLLCIYPALCLGKRSQLGSLKQYFCNGVVTGDVCK